MKRSRILSAFTRAPSLIDMRSFASGKFDQTSFTNSFNKCDRPFKAFEIFTSFMMFVMTAFAKRFKILYHIVVSIFIFVMNIKIFNRSTSLARRFFKLSICLYSTFPHRIFITRMIPFSTDNCIVAFSATMFSCFFSTWRNHKRFFAKFTNNLNSSIIPSFLSFNKGPSSSSTFSFHSNNLTVFLCKLQAL